MKLTGKCEVDFEKWYCLFEDFYYLDLIPNNMKYGVHEDFFNSVGIILDIQPVLEYNDSSYIKVRYYLVHVILLNSDAEYDYTECKTKQEARDAAIEKANELYNNKN
jgi:hypothetical protein